jgi:tRNA threonylcarbamoyladenosine biosynthesis protein TsaB
MSFMKILAFELSTTCGSMAWLDGDTEFFREWPNDRKNSELFFENLGNVRKQFHGLDMIVVGLGPGSYAGIRIAISAAVGLQAASNARLVGMPSICAIESDTQEYCVIGDARRNSFFLARIRGNELVEGPDLFAENQLRGKLNKLDMPIFASEKLSQFERVVIRHPSAKVLARLALNPGRTFISPPLEPLYLREPHITVPKTDNRSIRVLAGEDNTDWKPVPW